MYISCCSWALAGPDDQILAQLANIGFQLIDFRPFDFHSDVAQSKMRSLKLTPSCMATAFGMPEGASLDSADTAALTAARNHIIDALGYAARLGMTRAYLLPGLDADTQPMRRYAESLRILGDCAYEHGIRLCIEHFPGRSLPTVQATLDFIEDIGHPGLNLVLDVGHAQISREDPVEAIAKAGDRLAYVHLDDNDGVDDLHWALGDGVMTLGELRRTLEALQGSSYDGPVSLELHPTLPDPVDALTRSLDLVCQII